jgi:uncharacterized protein Yka (UPF0111/DUF47 family)
MWKQFAQIAQDLVVCENTLRKAIEKLGSDPVKVLELSKQIDKIEGKVDEKYLKSKKMLLEVFKEMGAATILLLEDLLEEMEHMVDSCDDTADYVRILTGFREIH